MTDDRADIRRFLQSCSTKTNDLFLRYGILQRCHQLNLPITKAESSSSTELVDYLLEECRGNRLTKRPDSSRITFPADLQSCRDKLAVQTRIQERADERRRRSSSAAAFDGLLPVEDNTTTPAMNTTPDEPPYRCDSVTLGRDSHRPVRADHYEQRPIIHISCGTHHTLVITDDGRLWASGDYNSNGRLGTGDEMPRHVPVVICTHSMVKASAAETHSLALTNTGIVYAFGSNRFGQVGTSPSLKPRKVDIKARIIDIAAGTRHSIALCEDGFVYGWGDNSAGQLGSAVLRNSNRKVHRIESLHEIIAIAAADQSTLALTARHTVYAWGHGNPVPTKVVIAATITAISAAKHHNVALANDGTVYAWGLHGDSLGSAQRPRARVQRVELPEPAVAVSASEYHTAVITAHGHLFTFGDAPDTNILGHAGVRWQPEPKRVPGVQRAVRVAAAKEHMAIMVCTTLPSIPKVKSTASMADLAARKLAERVDLFNCVSILIVAERTQSEFLLSYCHEFVRQNLDGVLNVGQKAVMHSYLQEQILSAQPQGNEDALTQIIMAGTRPGRSLCTLNEWAEAVYQLVDSDAEVCELWKELTVDPTSGNFGLVENCFSDRAACEGEAGRRTRKESFAERSSIDLDDLVICTKELAIDTLAMLNKEARAIRKRLGQIEKLERLESRTPDQERKMARKPLLESDLKALGPSILRVEAKIRSFVLLEEDEETRTVEASNREVEAIGTTTYAEQDNKDDPLVVEVANRKVDATDNEPAFASPDQDKKPEEASVPVEDMKPPAVELPDESADENLQSFRCDVCCVKCSDSSSYYSHIHGRKHRNKIAQAIQEEKDKATASLLEEQRIKIFQKQDAAPIDKPKPPFSAWKKDLKGSTPFKLPPPPHPVMEMVRKPAPAAMKPPPSFGCSVMSTISTSSSLAGSAPNQSMIKTDLASSPPNSFVAPWSCAPSVSLVESEAPHKNLRQIMQEESQQKNSKSAPKSSTPSKTKLASVTPVKLAKQVPHLSEPLPSYSLSEFLPSSTPKKVISTAKGWGSPATPVVKPVNTALSFKEIQEQEEAFQTKQDHAYANNGQWFVERRERANSLQEIQKSAAAERQEREFIEEQKRIEAQIYEELRATKAAAERAQKNKQKKRAKKKAALKKQQASKKTTVLTEA